MKYKNILVVTTRYPYPINGGDKLRISQIIKFLSKKNQVDLVSLGNKFQKKKYIKNQFLFSNNFFLKIFNILKSLYKKEPLQVGLYKNTKMKKKISDICNNYDIIIFHLIRSAYFLPKTFTGVKILEMTDLISKNYDTVEKNLSNLNLLKYIYKFEQKKLQQYETKMSKKFNRVIFVNKDDLENSKLKNKSNVFIIGNGTHSNQNIYFKNENKNNIVFFGNINSLANRSACNDFINNYLPILQENYPEIKFRIVGNCSKILRLYFKYKGVDVKHNVKNLKDISKKSLAGICNVKIRSGLQNKILEYSGIGLPILVNKASNNFKYLKGKNMLEFTDKNEFFSQLKKLLKNSKFRKNISKINFAKTRKHQWGKTLKNYLN